MGKESWFKAACSTSFPVARFPKMQAIRFCFYNPLWLELVCPSWTGALWWSESKAIPPDRRDSACSSTSLLSRIIHPSFLPPGRPVWGEQLSFSLSSHTLSHWTILSTGALHSLCNGIYRLHLQLNCQASPEGCISQQSWHPTQDCLLQLLGNSCSSQTI